MQSARTCAHRPRPRGLNRAFRSRGTWNLAAPPAGVARPSDAEGASAELLTEEIAAARLRAEAAAASVAVILTGGTVPPPPPRCAPQRHPHGRHPRSRFPADLTSAPGATASASSCPNPTRRPRSPGRRPGPRSPASPDITKCHYVASWRARPRPERRHLRGPRLPERYVRQEGSPLEQARE